MVKIREELEKVKSYGIEYAQGYFFSKPMPQADVEDYVLGEYLIGNLFEEKVEDILPTVEATKIDIKEELVDRVILKELKTVKEQLDSCPADRADLLEEYQARYDVINAYAPTMMSEEEVKAFITEKFAELVASKNKGMIMKSVMPELKGKADGKVINEVVGELCK